jgi:putative ABC transport system permease protein
VLGVTPAAGRGLVEADTTRGAPPVLILSHAAWKRRFGADPAALGGSVLLNGISHTVVGILPADFEFPLRGQAEFWLPLRPSQPQEERGYWHWMDVIGRLRPEATPASVDADLAAIATGFSARDTKFHAATLLRTQLLREVIVGDVRPTIHALLAGVALVLIATCATMAGLLLSRARGRLRELSVRAAVGAGRGRLVRQLVTENILLALMGGIAGVLAGRWLLQAFAAMVPAAQQAALPHFQEIGLHPVTLAAIFGLTLLTGLLFGVWPALRTSRADSSDALKGTRSTGSRRDGRMRFALVSLQVAVAFVLLSGAALIGTSVHRLLQKDPGFDTEGLVTMRVTLSGQRYAEDEVVTTFQGAMMERLRAMPGVTGVAYVNQAPLTGRGDTGTPMVVGRPAAAAGTSPDVGLRTVSPNYFETLGIPLVRGRAFDERATSSTPGAVLINQLLADQLFPSTDPVGQRLTFEFAPGPWEVVGVVGNEQLDDLDQPFMPVVYFSSRQDAMRSMTLIVRGAQPEALPGAARAAIAELDPTLPLFGVRTVEQLTMNSSAVFMRRAAMWLLGVFAVAAVLLAGVALYGVLAQAVSERTREIGVRMALGARRADVFGLVLRGGAMAVGLGILIGVFTATLMSGVLRSLLFDVSSGDPRVLSACAAVLAAAALLACAGPLSRAVRISPATALRGD